MGYLTECGVSAWQDDHHGDVVSTIWHLQQLHMIIREILVPELGLLVHHVDGAGATLTDMEVCVEHLVFIKLVLPLTLKGRKCAHFLLLYKLPVGSLQV